MYVDSDLKDQLIRTHGLTLAIFWGIGIDLSAFLIRYLKHFPWALYLHGSWMAMQSLLTLGLAIYMLVIKWSVIW